MFKFLVKFKYEFWIPRLIGVSKEALLPDTCGWRIDIQNSRHINHDQQYPPKVSQNMKWSQQINHRHYSDWQNVRIVDFAIVGKNHGRFGFWTVWIPSMSFILSRDARASSYTTLAYLVGMPFSLRCFPVEHNPLMPSVFFQCPSKGSDMSHVVLRAITSLHISTRCSSQSKSLSSSIDLKFMMFSIPPPRALYPHCWSVTLVFQLPSVACYHMIVGTNY